MMCSHHVDDQCSGMSERERALEEHLTKRIRLLELREVIWIALLTAALGWGVTLWFSYQVCMVA